MVKVTISDRPMKASVLLETAEIIIREKERLRIPFKEMKSLSASKGVLSFLFNGNTISLSIGDKAEKWLEKIKNPKSVLEKLGVKQGVRVSIINIEGKDFLREIKSKTGNVKIGSPAKGSDLIFYEANNPGEVEKLSSLKNYIKPGGGIWVVSLKGKAATIKDVEIMKIGKKCGLVDNKVVGFSGTHTALKFVIPVKDRKQD